jgi:hypothetical protein
MELYKIKPKFMNLIDKLELARQIYEKAAERVHNGFMTDQFQTIASKKVVYIREIANLFDFDYDAHSLAIRDKLKLEMEKIGIELNHLILHRNEKVLLEYCINREQEIERIYKDILKNGSYNDLTNTVIRNQMKETIEILDELMQVQEQYDFKEDNS